jgi:hypothetical protein
LPGCFTERHAKPVPLGGARYQDPHRPPLASPQSATPTTLLKTSSLLISGLDLSREKFFLWLAPPFRTYPAPSSVGAAPSHRSAAPSPPRATKSRIPAPLSIFLLSTAHQSLLRPFSERSNHLLGTLPRGATSKTVDLAGIGCGGGWRSAVCVICLLACFALLAAGC